MNSNLESCNHTNKRSFSFGGNSIFNLPHLDCPLGFRRHRRGEEVAFISLTLFVLRDFFRGEGLRELILVELDLLKAAAREQEEGNDAGDRNEQSSELPVPRIATVAVVNVRLDGEQQKEPESERDDVLDADGKVEHEVRLPPEHFHWVGLLEPG